MFRATAWPNRQKSKGKMKRSASDPGIWPRIAMGGFFSPWTLPSLSFSFPPHTIRMPLSKPRWHDHHPSSQTSPHAHLQANLALMDTISGAMTRTDICLLTSEGPKCEPAGSTELHLAASTPASGRCPSGVCRSPEPHARERRRSFAAGRQPRLPRRLGSDRQDHGGAGSAPFSPHNLLR